eukprot:1541969-Amphidinium_carterae.1
MHARVRSHLRDFVVSQQATIKLDVPGHRPDIEADEVTFAKRAVDGGVTWTQYLGMVRRGAPDSLIMIKLPDRVTSKRAPGPGPLLKDDWLPIAEQFLSGKDVVLNTDSARAYEAEIEG